MTKMMMAMTAAMTTAMTKQMKVRKTAGLDVANRMDNNALVTDTFLLTYSAAFAFDVVARVAAHVATEVESMTQYQLLLQSLLLRAWNCIF